MDHEITHEGKLDMHKGHHRPWQNNWKSPVSIGIFLVTTALAIAILLYTILNVVGAILEAMHPAASQGMSAQEMQQLEQQMPSSGSAAQ